MKKRLRKKKNLGEFRIWSVQLRFRLDVASIEEHVDFMRALHDDLAHHDVFGGGVGDGTWETLYLCRMPNGGRFDEALDEYRQWLEGHDAVRDLQVSPYHEDGDDVDFETGRVIPRPDRRRHRPGFRRTRTRRERRQRRAAVGFAPQWGRKPGIRRMEWKEHLRRARKRHAERENKGR